MGKPEIMRLPFRVDEELGSGLTVHRAIEKYGFDNVLSMRRNEFEGRVVVSAHEYMLAEPCQPLMLHSNFSRFALPASEITPLNSIWKCVNGKFEAIMSPGHAPAQHGSELVGLPYGINARLLLLYVNDAIWRSPSGQLSFGSSMSQFMRKMNLHVRGGRFGSIPSLKNQMRRLARCRFEFISPDKWNLKFQLDDFGFFDSQLWAIAEGYQSWPTEIKVPHEMAASIKKHAYPIDPNAISILRPNVLAIDWYLYLSWRLTRVKRTEFVPWYFLFEQFGQSYARIADFKKASRMALKFVSAVYPGANLVVTDGGLELLNSEASVSEPKKHKKICVGIR